MPFNHHENFLNYKNYLFVSRYKLIMDYEDDPNISNGNQVTCYVCGEKFVPVGDQLNALKKGRNVFCSNSCFIRVVPPEQVHQMVCHICGKSFTPTDKQLAALKKGQNLFCSNECYVEGGRERAKNLAREKLEREVVYTLESINPAVSEAIKEYAIEIAGLIDGGNGYKTSDVAKAVVLAACDKSQIGYKLKVNPKVLKMVREKSGVYPIIDVKDIIPCQVELLSNIAGWDEEAKWDIMEKALGIADVIDDVKGTLAVKAAAMVYVASRAAGESVTQKQIADIVGASDESIRKTYKDLTEKLGISITA